MKVGDLIRHKRMGNLALVVEVNETINDDGRKTGLYHYPAFMWLDTGEIDSCASTFLEVVNESR